MIKTTRRHHVLALTAAVLAIAAATAVFAHVGPSTQIGAVKWTEMEWRMPLDNWGQGRAWRTMAPGGGEVQLYARTKTGFCNCFNGIADDVEIDRIGDVDLHGDNFLPTSPGQPTAVGDLSGRERAFQTNSRWGGARHVLSIVAASDCKAVVATLVSDRPIPAAAEISAVAVLKGESFRRWADNQ